MSISAAEIIPEDKIQKFKMATTYGLFPFSVTVFLTIDPPLDTRCTYTPNFSKTGQSVAHVTANWLFTTLASLTILCLTGSVFWTFHGLWEAILSLYSTYTLNMANTAHSYFRFRVWSVVGILHTKRDMPRKRKRNTPTFSKIGLPVSELLRFNLF